MTKKELLDRCARDGAERVLLARVLDKLELAQDRGIPAHTPFLSPGEQASVTDLLNAWGQPRHIFWGGFPGAERALCAFLPDWQDENDLLLDPEGPLAALEAAFPPGSELSHRDILGSLMGLGLTREKLGDILLPGDRTCQVILLREVLPILLSQRESAGRWRLKLREIPGRGACRRFFPVPLQSHGLYLRRQGGRQPPGVSQRGQAGGCGRHSHLPRTGQVRGPGDPRPVQKGTDHAGIGEIYLSRRIGGYSYGTL